MLKDLNYVNEISLKEQNAKKGTVIIIRVGTLKIFSLVSRHRFYDLTSEDDLYSVLIALKKAMIHTNTKTIRLSKINDALDKLPDNSLRNIMSRVFETTDIKITLCLGKIEIPSLEKRKEIVREFHSSLVCGHKGLRKPYRRIRERFYWPNMVKETMIGM